MKNTIKSEISFHFGHAPFFTIFNTETEKIQFIKNEINHNDSKNSAVEQILSKTQATKIFVSQIGGKAKEEFKKFNCEITEHQKGSIKEILKLQ